MNGVVSDPTRPLQLTVEHHPGQPHPGEPQAPASCQGPSQACSCDQLSRVRLLSSLEEEPCLGEELHQPSLEEEGPCLGEELDQPISTRLSLPQPQGMRSRHILYELGYVLCHNYVTCYRREPPPTMFWLYLADGALVSTSVPPPVAR